MTLFLLGFLFGFLVRPARELAAALARRFAERTAQRELEHRATAADAARARSPRCECGHLLIDHWFGSSSGWHRGDAFSETPATLSTATEPLELTGECYCTGGAVELVDQVEQLQRDTGCECGLFRVPGSARAAAAAVVQLHRCPAVSHGALTPHGMRCTLRAGHPGGHTFGALFPRQCDARRPTTSGPGLQRCRLLQQHDGEHVYDDDERETP